VYPLIGQTAARVPTAKSATQPASRLIIVCGCRYTRACMLRAEGCLQVTMWARHTQSTQQHAVKIFIRFSRRVTKMMSTVLSSGCKY
jgi:hypothetical protein